MNHEIDLQKLNLRTDLAIEEVKKYSKYMTVESINNINVTTIIIDDTNSSDFMKKNGKYVTIEFKDGTDFNNGKQIEEVFIKELQKFFKMYNINEKSTCLVIGLGNEKSTPDSLGPIVLNNIIVTSHYYILGIDVEDGFRSVAAISPGVMGQTGIETFEIISSIVNNIKPDFLIVIDSLKASQVERINKTIQITDAGILPGSGIGNNRKEISKDVLGIPVFAIGIPTVVDSITIVNDSINYMANYYSYMKKNIDNPKEKLKIIRTNFKNFERKQSEKEELFGFIGSLSEEELKSYIHEVLVSIGYNLIVTPKEIDFEIKKLGNILSNGINNALHKNVKNI